MEIKNYTPHNVTIIGETNVTYKSEGLARCSQTNQEVFKINGIPVVKTVFGEVSGLPKEQDGVFYIVSAIVANALKGKRSDLLVPSMTVRDENGQIIGCKGFAVI